MKRIVTKREQQLQKIHRILMAKRTTLPKESSVSRLIQQKITSDRNGSVKTIINQNKRLNEQAKNNRPERVNRSTPINNKVIFFSGGIGDVLAIESYIPEEKKQSIEIILYGTRKHDPIQQLLQTLPNYPNLKEHRVVWSDFTNFWCFIYKTECENRYQRNGLTAPALLQAAEDYSIAIKFPLIRSGNWPFIGSSFLKYQLANIDRLKLPEQYIVIAPYSSDKANSKRDFNSADWDATLATLYRHGVKGVVVNNGTDVVPKTDQIIDLSNKTSILESIEVVKKAKAYMGIDTCFSVLAAQIFQSSNLVIKCVNNHGLNNKEIYFAPHKTFEFIVSAVNMRSI